MFSSSFSFSNFKKTLLKNQQKVRESRITRDPDEEVKSKVAVRFFVKKSKRFDFLNSSRQRKMPENKTKISLRRETPPECLLYLGLAPKNRKIRDRDEDRALENRRDEFEFTKPRIYECNHCSKIFFHKLLYRRHMIHHIRKSHWCVNCNRKFSSRIARSRHQLMCHP